MSLEMCMVFLAFNPVIFFAAYILKSKVALSIGIFSILTGSVFAYFIYNDADFWTGWIHSWHRSAQVGFGHSALIFTLVCIACFLTGDIKRKKNEKAIEHVDLNTGKVTYKDK